MMILKVYDKLKKEKLNPYFIGQHKGLCNTSYCVIKEGNQIPSINSNRVGQKVIYIIVFVPANSYISIDPYVKSIKLAIEGLKNIRKTGLETPVVTDDDKKAYTMSIEYVVQKKLEG